VPLLQSAWPPLPVAVSAPGGITPLDYLQDYLDGRARSNATAVQGKVMGKELQRALGKPTEMPALRDSQSFRRSDGQKVVRTGDGCAQIQTVQASPSPTNHVDIAEPIDCPGGTPDASQEMGKSLDDWAKKLQQSQAPPPR
jgi:hypothetical protein